MQEVYNSRLHKTIQLETGMGGLTYGYDYFKVTELRGWDATVIVNGKEVIMPAIEIRELVRDARTVSLPSLPRRKEWIETLQPNPETPTEKRSREYFESLGAGR